MKDLRRKQVVSIQYYNSPCGEIIMASAGDGLCLCDWNKMPCAERNKRRLMRLQNAECIIAPSVVLKETKKELDEYFAGKRHTFEIPLHPVGTDFQKQVWQALLEIPYGETRTYKEIAQKINKLKGIRAVAQAIGANGISILIPCHRVIGTNRSLTGYAGGIEAKRLLLNIECQNTLWLSQQLNFYNFRTQRKMSKLINSISPFEKAKLGILLPIAVQLLLERDNCAISRHFYCISIYKNSISNYKNGSRKNPSPFITLHLFVIFRFRQTDRAWLMRLLRPVQGVYYDQAWLSIKTWLRHL